MPFWPFFMGTAFLLSIAGWRHGVWLIPALALLGYIGMRGVMNWVPLEYLEVAACTLWLLIASVMMYNSGWVPGFFYSLSALTYPAFLLFGFRIEYLGLSLIVSEIFAVLALLSIGGGIVGMANTDSGPSRLLSRLAPYSVGMAAR